MKNNICKFFRKNISFLIAICLCLTSISLNSIISVFAGELGQELSFTDGVANGDYIEFYDGETLLGKIQVKIGGDVLTPVDNKVMLPEYDESYQVSLHLTESPGYEASNYSVNGESGDVPGDKIINIDVTSEDDIVVSINFSELGDPEGPPPAMYPLLAYFEGIPEPVESSPENTILIPDEWTSGTVSFKAKICMVGGEIRPDDGNTTCDPDTQSLSDLNIQGITNRDQIDRTVSGYDDDHIIIEEGFLNYGIVGIHLTNEDLNLSTNIISNDLIYIEAIAPMPMSYSLGTSTIDKAIVTNNNTGDISIFFGNMEVELFAIGPNVVGITNLSGAEYNLNDEDQSVTVYLPPLSEETTTSVSITIELSGGSTVTRQINIIRTAIELSYEGESKTIRAGYVMNKAYLYNNQPHNDDIFNAYLQVIIYRDNIVVGYRQVQIDDESLVNSLEENESGAMESLHPESLVVYDGSIEGANKVSVFLTNGPIDFDSDTLPSIEFGIGSGVILEWGND